MAIIMDGNGRWATAQGRPRPVGHRIGCRTVRRIVDAAPTLGITTLTLYAFSTDNWARPPREVGTLMRLLHGYLRETARVEPDVRLSVIGYRHDLSPVLRQAISDAEEATKHGSGLHLRLAVNYSARRAIVLAAERMRAARDFPTALGQAYGGGEAPDVDLLIRTGGEQRLSDFLLWECAYAELLFVPKMWPEFTPDDLAAAVAKFQQRKRRFGRTPDQAA